ncbi:isoleucine-tRNA ligase, partial [Ascosphaera pollenicola]
MGTGSQARVAQACDRCRSKKIRCDGKQPRCTSCASIGFDCKTSDKLSRRAFPRGYTESLEQRVIALEASIHESEALIQAKDTEIEALKTSAAEPSSSASSSAANLTTGALTASCEDSFSFTGGDAVDRIQQRPALLLPTENAPFQGPSSTKSLLYSFKTRIAAQGGSCNISEEALLAQEWELRASLGPADTNDPSIAVSDELFRTWFAEWAPLFPVLHQPTSENAYMLYCKSPSAFAPVDLLYVKTHLNLIYAIVTLVSKV